MQDRGAATRERVLEVARSMIQEQGYNGVSFRDLSAALDIKAASIHYYFPNKESLVAALVERYRASFTDGRRGLDGRALSAVARLEKYVDLIRAAFRETGRMCLCGVLAAEISTLPEGVTDGVRAFFAENEAWLSGVLSEGRRAGELYFRGTPDQTA